MSFGLIGSVRRRFGAQTAAPQIDVVCDDIGADDCDIAGFRGSWRSFVPRAGLGLGLAALFLTLLSQRVQDLDIAAIGLAMAEVGAQGLAGALVLTATAFWAVGQYDAVLHRHFATGVDARAARRAGISAIAVSQTLGLGLVTGSILRWRMLPEQSFWLASKITLAVALSFLAGWAVVTALVHLTLGQGQVILASAAVLAIAAIAIVLTALRPAAPFRWPNLLTVLSLLGFCAIDTFAAAGALWVLLPADMGVGFDILLPAFLLAYGAGLVSGTPGGIGAFELALLAMLPGHAPTPILAAVIAWRLVYFVLPAVLGALVAMRGPLHSGLDGPRAQLQTSQGYLADIGGPVLRAAESGLMAQGEHQILAQGRVGQMVSQRGHVLVGLLDPMMPASGSAQRRARYRTQAVEMLAQTARAQGRVPAIYKASAPMVLAARQMGWRAWRISREAVVIADRYTLNAPSFAGLRRKLRRSENAGLCVQFCPADKLPLAHMAALSQQWARDHGGERGFSMGRFDAAYVSGQKVYLGYVAGQLAGFITLHCCGAVLDAGGDIAAEWTLDVMRYSRDLPDGGMHALVHAAILDAKAQGAARISLAAVPESAFLPRSGGKVGFAAQVTDRGCRLLGLDNGTGLRRFKDTFAPDWQPRYLCAPHIAGLVVAAASIWRAVHWPQPGFGNVGPTQDLSQPNTQARANTTA